MEMWQQPSLNNVKFKDDADSIADDLYSAAIEFQGNLDDDHEVGVMLASFGQSVTVNITGIGYKGKKLIKFIGYIAESGMPVELLQHVSQLNFLFVTLPRENKEEPRKQIGFIAEN
jgi:hypothetical protein